MEGKHMEALCGAVRPVKPKLSRDKEGTWKGWYRVTDGLNSGIANNPEDAYSAYQSAKAETEAFYGTPEQR